jgi:hypothetical protein
MSWLSRFSPARVRLTGPPPSGNGASSFHLWWVLPAAGPFSEVTAVLEVSRPPAVTKLYFWALQVSFVEAGREVGAGHTGLQWHPSAPAGAVNWGGYYSGGAPPGGDGTLPGTGSALPPVDGGPHTRHFAWSPGRSYRFRVWSPAVGAWRSEVTDIVNGETTVIRDLLVDAQGLANPLVWSEVFAACDDPSTEVRWSQLHTLDEDGVTYTARSVNLTYQSFADGGCSNTQTYADGDCFVQVTGLPAARPAASGVVSLPDPGTGADG